MKSILLIFLSAVAFGAKAAPVLSVSLAGTSQLVYPGAVLNMQITLSGSTGLNMAGLGFSSWTPVSNLAAGTASVTAQKTLWTGTNGVLLTGLTAGTGSSSQTASNLAFADGQILTFSYTVPATQTVGSTLSIAIPTPVFAVDTGGLAMAVTVTPLTLPVVINPVCFTTANADVQAFLAAPGTNLLGQLVVYLASIVAGTCH
jgi:hypothetical protein